MIPVFKYVGVISTAKNYLPVTPHSAVGKLVNKSLIDHFKKYDLFPNFQYGVRSSCLTADLLIVDSNSIAKNFNRSVATQAVGHNISKAFDTVISWYSSETQLRSSIWPYCISSCSNMQRWVVLYGKSQQKYPVNTGVSQGSIHALKLFLLYINDLLDDVICNIGIYADTKYCKCELASELRKPCGLG